ncbi:MAG: FAD binding domain-containing protein [Halobacteriota archaeon]
MYPGSFEYFSPHSLNEAVELLGDRDVRILAGGQSLIPSLKLRTLSVKSLVDIGGIKELRHVRQKEDGLEIGSMVTVAALENDGIVSSLLPIVREAAEHIADPLVRNRGTIGGNLCHGDPTNDLPAVMLALNSSMTALSRRGLRKIDVDSFFAGTSGTALAPDEILTHVEIPTGERLTGAAYRKVRKGSGGFSIAGVAACLSVADDHTVARCRIAMTAVGPRVLRAENAERTLLGNVPTDSVLDDAAALAVAASHPSTDLNASKEYRRSTLYRLVKEAVSASYNRATAQERSA